MDDEIARLKALLSHSKTQLEYAELQAENAQLQKRLEVLRVNRNDLFDKNVKLKAENESLLWFVSSLSDVFDYNEHSKIPLLMIQAWLNTVIVKDNFTKDDFQKIHMEIIELGLVTLPTTKKAIEALKG